MRRACLTLSVLSLTLAGLVSAQAPRLPETLDGEWRSSVAPDRAVDIAMAAFRPRLENIPSFIRGRVESRIAERMHPVERIEITTTGDRVRVVNHTDRVETVETRLGESTRMRGRDGEMRRVTQRVRGGWLEQVFQGDDGSVSRLLSTEPDGQTLHVDVTVRNERLGDPVRWRVDFRR
ncbi:MAG: hypothetical protein AB8I08_36680 [Sandaracinaceae bacterium]